MAASPHFQRPSVRSSRLGAPPLAEPNDNVTAVIAWREIAEGKLSPLRVHSFALERRRARAPRPCCSQNSSVNHCSENHMDEMPITDLVRRRIAGLPRLTQTLRSWRERFRQWRRRHRSCAELLSLDERMLADLGFQRVRLGRDHTIIVPVLDEAVLRAVSVPNDNQPTRHSARPTIGPVGERSGPISSQRAA